MFFLTVVKVLVILAATEAHYHYTPKCNAVADIIFVYDTSGSIGNPNDPSNFNDMKMFMTEFVDLFNTVGVTGTQFAALCFSTLPIKHFYLNENNNDPDPKQATKDDIAAFPIGPNGATAIGDALQEVSTDFLTQANGIGRTCAQCFVILITDGTQNAGVADPVSEANGLRAKNCIVFVVSVGLANSPQIEAIAGGPNNVFNVDQFGDLETIVQEFVQAVCKNAACTTDSDNNGGGYSNNYKKTYSHGHYGGATKPNYNGGYSDNYGKSYSYGGATYPSNNGGYSDNYGKSYSHGGVNTNMNPAPMPNRTPTSYPKYLNQRNNLRNLISRYGYGYNYQPKPSHNHYVYPGQYKK